MNQIMDHKDLLIADYEKKSEMSDHIRRKKLGFVTENDYFWAEESGGKLDDNTHVIKQTEIDESYDTEKISQIGRLEDIEMINLLENKCIEKTVKYQINKWCHSDSKKITIYEVPIIGEKIVKSNDGDMRDFLMNNTIVCKPRKNQLAIDHNERYKNGELTPISFWDYSRFARDKVEKMRTEEKERKINEAFNRVGIERYLKKQTFNDEKIIELNVKPIIYIGKSKYSCGINHNEENGSVGNTHQFIMHKQKQFRMNVDIQNGMNVTHIGVTSEMPRIKHKYRDTTLEYRCSPDMSIAIDEIAYVKKFKLFVLGDSKKWVEMKTFTIVNNHHQETVFELNYPKIHQIKIVPIEYHIRPAMRISIYGIDNSRKKKMDTKKYGVEQKIPIITKSGPSNHHWNYGIVARNNKKKNIMRFADDNIDIT